MRKTKVVISSIWYPLCMARYFVEAFKRRDDVELMTVGPFTNDYIPWSGGVRLPRKYVMTPDVPFGEGFIGVRPNHVIAQAQLPWKPDLWLQIDAGWYFSDKPEASVVAHVATDPHVLTEQYRVPKAYSDVCFGMQTPYLQPKDVFLPYAADPIWHAPLEGMPKEYDCCLIGLHYEHRDRLVNYLRSKGLRVYYDIGPVYHEYQILNSKAHTILSWSSLQDTPARVYEGMFMAVPLVANRTPDLVGQFVEGDHFLGFDTVEEAYSQVIKLLNDEDMRQEMAWNAHRKVSAQHLWDHRAESILDKCGLIFDAQKANTRQS